MFELSGHSLPDGTFKTPGTLFTLASLAWKPAGLLSGPAPPPFVRIAPGPLLPLPPVCGPFALLLDHLVVSTTPTDGSKLFFAYLFYVFLFFHFSKILWGEGRRREFVLVFDFEVRFDREYKRVKLEKTEQIKTIRSYVI